MLCCRFAPAPYLLQFGGCPNDVQDTPVNLPQELELGENVPPLYYGLVVSGCHGGHEHGLWGSGFVEVGGGGGGGKGGGLDTGLRGCEEARGQYVRYWRGA